MNTTYQNTLELLVKGNYKGFAGLSTLGRDFGSIFDKQKQMVLQSKLFADSAVKESARAQTAYERANAAILKSNDRLSKATISLNKAAADGNIAQYRRYQIEVEAANRAIVTSTQRAADLQIEANRKVAAAQDAQARASRTKSTAAVAGGVRATSTGFLTAGGLLTGSALYAGIKSAGWQRTLSQTQANTTLTDAQMKALNAFVFGQAGQSGGDLTQILNAGRYGSDMGLNFGLNKRTVAASVQAALPGGNNISDFMQAVATGQVNFPGMRNDPKRVAAMILMAAKMGRMNPGDLATAIPQTLVVAGHYGNGQMADALAAVSALTRAGMPVDEANTQVYNMYAHIPTPAAGTKKLLNTLAQHGVDLRSDFTAQGLKQKGLAGVLMDIRQANLAPDVLKGLLPNMRGYFGALGLSGNQAGSFLDIKNALNGPGAIQSMGDSYKRYLGLDTTKYAIAQRQFQIDMLKFGQTELPILTNLLKAVNPLITAFSSFTDTHKTLGAAALILGPALLGVGAGLRAISALASAGSLLGLGKVFSAMRLAVVGGEAGAAGGEAGVGLLGALGVGGPILLGVGALALGGVVLYNKWKPFHDLVNATLNFIGGMVQGLGQFLGLLPSPQKNSPSTNNRIAGLADGRLTPKGWTTGVGGVPFSGAAFGAFNNPANNYQNRDITNTANGRWSQQVLGTNGPIYDTDFVASGNKPTPFHLPGNSKYTWTFVRIVQDNKGGGGTGEVWKTPQGHEFIFWHTSAQGVPTKRVSQGRGGFVNEPVNPSDPQLWDPSSYHGLTPGQKAQGGTTVGLSGVGDGVQHLCIVTSAAGRSDILSLDPKGIQLLRQKGYKVTQLPATGGAGGVPSGVRANWGLYQSAGAQSGVSPYILAGMTQQESSGNPNNLGYSAGPGTDTPQVARVQVPGAAATIRSWEDAIIGKGLNKAWKNTLQQEMRQQGLDPNNANDRQLVALAIYNSGPNGWMNSGPRPGEAPGQYKHGLVYARAVVGYGTAFAGGSSSSSSAPSPTGPQVTLASLGLGSSARTPKPHHYAPYSNVLYTERHQLANLNEMWRGINPAQLPSTGNGGMNQQAYLRYQYQRNELTRQIADNSAKQYAILHKMSPAWLKQTLLQDNIAKNTANANARANLAKKLSGGGAASRVQPVHIVGRCAAEAAANVHRGKTANATQTTATHAATTARSTSAIASHTKRANDLLAKLLDKFDKVVQPLPPGHTNDPRHLGLHPMPLPGA